MVDENVETIEGRPLGSLRRERERRISRIRRWTVAAGSVALALVAAVLVAARSTNGSSHQTPAVPLEPASISEHDYTVTSPPSGDQIARDLASGEGRSLVPAVIPLAVQRIAVDAGHGGIDGGTSVGYGLTEKDLTLDIANRLSTLLERAGCEVVLTRTGDREVSLKERATLANRSRADLFVSIHINWLPDRTARGFETYYLGPTDDPFLRRLAAAENKDSGYALADYRRLLEGIYADVRRDQSRRLAATVQSALYETLVEDNPSIVSRGVMSAPFVVLVATEMPAILAEVACLSNDKEARLLAIPRYRQRIASALYTGILRYSQTVNSSANADPKGTTG
jgi:N-acetylmuramoyl-L-alanine amidase